MRTLHWGIAGFAMLCALLWCAVLVPIRKKIKQ